MCTEDDPITLQPLSDLDHPPFQLSSGINGTGPKNYFDPVALASYLTKSGP